MKPVAPHRILGCSWTCQGRGDRVPGLQENGADSRCCGIYSPFGEQQQEYVRWLQVRAQWKSRKHSAQGSWDRGQQAGLGGWQGLRKTVHWMHLAWAWRNPPILTESTVCQDNLPYHMHMLESMLSLHFRKCKQPCLQGLEEAIQQNPCLPLELERGKDKGGKILDGAQTRQRFPEGKGSTVLMPSS